AIEQPSLTAGATFGRVHRNGGGDRYYFDGRIEVLKLPATCKLAAKLAAVRVG
ncbi:MAG: hypothetical protein JWO65_2624, partial [Sphingomonas bacterium]|nr:hypothetical protein [Sphingomonas bacterium]